jgi:hypothetical protein
MPCILEHSLPMVSQGPFIKASVLPLRKGTSAAWSRVMSGKVTVEGTITASSSL